MKQNILKTLMLIAVLLTGSHAFAHDLYKDGIYYKTQKVTNALGNITGLTLRNYPFYIGSRAGVSSIQKLNLKTLRIYTKELTLEEVQNNFAGENILKTNMIASFNFN